MGRFRIMHVIDSFGTGGTEEGIRKLLSGLDPATFEQIVCTVAPTPQPEARTGIRVISVGRPSGGRQVLVGRLKRMFDQERPHLVHSRNWGAIEAVPAARWAGVHAVVHSEHGLESNTIARQPWRRNVVRRLCFNWADRVFAVSQSLRAYYAEQLPIAPDRIRVIPNGVDTERFRPQMDARKAVRQKLKLTPEAMVVGTAGRLDPVKDHRTLFRAVELVLSQHVPVQLVIVGDGPERAALEADVRARSLLSGRALFVGERSEVASLMNGLDVFVLPSLAEGMSNALLEAMAVGIASVATRVGGNPELVEGGISGLLFEAGDTQALAGYLKALALDPLWRHSLGLAARKRVEGSFSLERMLGSYTQLYEDVLGHRRTRAGVLRKCISRANVEPLIVAGSAVRTTKAER